MKIGGAQVQVMMMAMSFLITMGVIVTMPILELPSADEIDQEADSCDGDSLIVVNKRRSD